MVLKEKQVFTLIPLSEVPKGKKVIGCQWVYVNKYDAKGNVVKWKTRLVAKGFLQVAAEDFGETYATIVRLESLRLTIAVIVQLGLHICRLIPCQYT